MQLLFCPEDMHSQKVLIALYEKLAQFDSQAVDIHDPSDMRFLAQIDPFASVPLLQLKPNTVVAQATIIIEFLDEELQQGSQLIPHEPNLAREVRYLDSIIQQHLYEPLLELKRQHQLKLPQQNRSTIQQCEHAINSCLSVLENRFEANYWSVADGFSLADCTLIPALSLACSVYPFSHMHQLNRYWQQVKFRGSYQLLQQQLNDMKGFENPFIAS
ncbi:glutathione S-transferase family protein [Paraferrimonas haliotis]|uniref:Glutathione S-transferase n=1 Tax=Paraferrimonas haliotis TaxID=2013866 RepID=A0AA37WZP7_9GAMM|nr:glutathione S-transferase family protein [Paraferrimonas haliotis]GLS84980.1 glutathione S-transferase [Paraferrimonas haliotis]